MAPKPKPAPRPGGQSARRTAVQPAAPNVFARAAAAFTATGTRIYFDLSPLREANWTGIPIVAAGLAQALLDLLPQHVHFFCDYDVIASAAVADALRRNTGLFLDRDIDQGYVHVGKLPVFGEAGRSIGLFPSVKPLRGAFDIDVSIFHDVSTLTLPLMHIRGNVLHHTEVMLADLASNDLTVTVSQATRDDLIAYVGIDPSRIVAAPNGVTWPAWYEAAATNLAGPAGVEPYFLILGTREPRKNITKVFELLERYPEHLQTHRFVFAGKMGWLEEQHLLPRALEPFVENGRIQFPGFIDEPTKYALLRHAEATLYPSIFEGFGLPVVESLSVGTPCVTSWSSAIPEVGGDVCEYFDPLDADDFHRAITALLARRGPALHLACREHARAFTWRATLRVILERLLALEKMRAT
jgi:glycosyltransferase involved in cell wall biosynthesis